MGEGRNGKTLEGKEWEGGDGRRKKVRDGSSVESTKHLGRLIKGRKAIGIKE